MKADIMILADRQKIVYEDLIPQLKEGIASIHAQIEAHTTDEKQEFQEIREATQKSAGHVEAIQAILDNVSANGNKGLSNSLTDVYKKLNDLEHITAPARARAKFWTAAHDILTTQPLLRPLRTWYGAFIYLSLLLLIINTILHPFGVHWDIVSLIGQLWSALKPGA